MVSKFEYCKNHNFITKQLHISSNIAAFADFFLNQDTIIKLETEDQLSIFTSKTITNMQL